MSESPQNRISAQPVVERHSIDYVPRSERRGKLWHQAPFWFTGNFVILTMIVGFTGPNMGLSVGWAVLAVTLGAGLGTFFMAFHANQGPHMGLPQMIQSRAQFGRRGAVVPFAATVFVYIGFIVFDVILATDGLNPLLPGPAWLWYPLLVAISIVIAVVGHDLLHFVQRWLTYLLVITFGIVTILAIFVLPTDAGAPAETAGWNLQAFLVQFSLAAGYNISYAVYVSDYSRYLPETSSARQLVGWTYLGAAGSAVWLMSLGAILASKIPGADGIGSLVTTGDLLFPGFGRLVVTVGAVALITIMGVNAYGAMLTGVSIVDGFKPVAAKLATRIIGLIIAGILSVALAVAIPENYLDAFDAWVALMLYFLVPWTSVNLADFYFIRHAKYAITQLFSERSIYGNWGWRGLVAYIAGFVAMVPFFTLSFYTGPAARALGGADVSFIVGIIVSGGLYLIFAQSIDRSAEERVRRDSLLELEGTTDAP